MKNAEDIWAQYGSDADWERYDTFEYEDACNITLDVDGYRFYGDGSIVCGEKEINELWCTTPEGVEIKII